MKEDFTLFIPDEHARRSLATKLGLEYNIGMQDWEYEVSDYSRLPEFILEYDKPETTIKEKASLMEIILDSLNDLLENGRTREFESNFSKVKERLTANDKIHSGTLQYWATKNFKISERLKRK